MEISKIGIEKFDGSDFSFWKMQIEDYLYQKNLHEPLLGVMLDTMTTEQWKLKDRKDLGMIWLTLSRNVAFNIIKVDNVRSNEGTVEYVRKTVGYEQGVFDAKIVQSTDV